MKHLQDIAHLAVGAGTGVAAVELSPWYLLVIPAAVVLVGIAWGIAGGLAQGLWGEQR